MLTAKSTYDYINMESFAGSLNVLIIGASGGIGGAVISIFGNHEIFHFLIFYTDYYIIYINNSYDYLLFK